MAALIRFICDVEHAVAERESAYVPSLTIYEGDWAFCRCGGEDGHEWRDVEPALPIEQLRLTARGRFVLTEDALV
jgi:hypothetical protein